MKRIAFVAAMLAVACTTRQNTACPAYLNPPAPLEERVEDALGRLPTEEKVAK